MRIESTSGELKSKGDYVVYKDIPNGSYAIGFIINLAGIWTFWPSVPYLTPLESQFIASELTNFQGGIK